jgi:pimeloyl-ACP methyl ester carboxylesterase
MKRPAFYLLILAFLTIMTAEISQAQSMGKYTDVNGIKIYYEIHGTGQPLVLIHGGGSTINTTFGRVLPILAKTHKVIAVEMQAHGRTSDRDAPESFTQDAADIAELLKQLNIPKADIFGFSNGGQTALELGIKHPERVRRLVIASAFYKRSGVPAGFWKMFDDPKLEGMPQIYKDEFLRLRNDPAALMNMFRKDAARMFAFKDWSDDEIRSIKAPALVVIGDHDVPTPEHAIEMSRMLQNARLAIMPGGHGSYLGEAMSPDPNSRVPALFVEMVNEFLASPADMDK